MGEFSRHGLGSVLVAAALAVVAACGGSGDSDGGVPVTGEVPVAEPPGAEAAGPGARQESLAPEA